MTSRLDADGRREYFATLALRHCRGLGARRIVGLLRRHGSAHEAYRRLLEGSEAGVPPDAVDALRRGDWRAGAEAEWHAASRCRGGIVLWTDGRYPDALRVVDDAPCCLYVRGDAALLAGPCVGVVGARQASEEGIRAARMLASGLAASGVTVVSGMARGVDAAAHEAARSLPGRTVAVLGTGVDVVYPGCHGDMYEDLWRDGLLVSEHAPGTPPRPAHFPVRNRIISGLSLGVVVTEAMPGSGSLITARLAMEQNRGVYAVGGPIGSRSFSGCQELIRQGAVPVFSVEDVLCDLGDALADYGRTWGEARPGRGPGGFAGQDGEARAAPPRRVPDSADDVRSRVLTALAGEGPMTPDELCRTLAVESSEVSSVLVMLEVEGIVRRRVDGGYSLM